MSGRRSSPLSESGFTLAEVLVVIAIVSVVAMLAVPLLRAPPASVVLRSEASRLAAALRVTRAAAMARNEPMTLSLDVERGMFASPVVPPSSMDRRIAVSMVVAEPLRASAVRGGIRYFASGRSTGGRIVLKLGAAAATVNVNWATGDPAIDD